MEALKTRHRSGSLAAAALKAERFEVGLDLIAKKGPIGRDGTQSFRGAFSPPEPDKSTMGHLLVYAVSEFGSEYRLHAADESAANRALQPVLPPHTPTSPTSLSMKSHPEPPADWWLLRMEWIQRHFQLIAVGSSSGCPLGMLLISVENGTGDQRPSQALSFAADAAGAGRARIKVSRSLLPHPTNPRHSDRGPSSGGFSFSG
jgi:hypothetical protein